MFKELFKFLSQPGIVTQPERDSGFTSESISGKSSGGRSKLPLIIGGVLLLCLCGFLAISLTGRGGGDGDSGSSPRVEQDSGGTDLDSILDDEAFNGESSEATAAPIQTNGDEAALILANESAEAVCYVYISQSGSDDWGEDWLDDGDAGIVEPGEEVDFTVETGTFDIQALDCDENILDEQLNIPFATGEEMYWEIFDQ